MSVSKFVLCLVCLLGHEASAFLLASPNYYDIRLCTTGCRRRDGMHNNLPFLKSAVTNENEVSTKGQQRASLEDDDESLTSFASTATVAIPTAIVDDSAVVDCVVAAGVPPVASLTSTTVSTSLLQLAVAGAVATIIADISMHPVDTIKCLQQSDSGYGLSLTQATQVLYQTSGFAAFYHGFFTYAMTDAAGGALKFATFEFGKQQTNKVFPQLPQSATLFACAAMAFVASSIVGVPGELIKQQLQMNLYDGWFPAVSGIWHTGGIAGFFRGYSGVLLRDIPYTMLELGLYDMFKTVFIDYKKKQQQQEVEQFQDPILLLQEDANESCNQPQQPPVLLQAWEEIVAASLTGGIAAYLTTPLDTIKTKLMVDQALYSGGFWDCFMSTVDHHGVGGLFAGGAARIAWLLPYTAIYLPVYDLLKRKVSSMAEEANQQQLEQDEECIIQ